MPTRIVADCPCRECGEVYFWYLGVAANHQGNIYRIGQDKIDWCPTCDDVILDKFEECELWRHTDQIYRDDGILLGAVEIIPIRSGPAGAQKHVSSRQTHEQAGNPETTHLTVAPSEGSGRTRLPLCGYRGVTRQSGSSLRPSGRMRARADR